MLSHPPNAVQPRHIVVPVVPIQEIRGRRVILSSDLAEIYGVEPKVLNQAVKRNSARFPADFAFRLNLAEALELRRSRSLFVTLKRGQNTKYPPMAFTEHGALMAATASQSRHTPSVLEPTIDSNTSQAPLRITTVARQYPFKW